MEPPKQPNGFPYILIETKRKAYKKKIKKNMQIEQVKVTMEFN